MTVGFRIIKEPNSFWIVTHFWLKSRLIHLAKSPQWEGFFVLFTSQYYQTLPPLYLNPLDYLPLLVLVA